MLIQLLTISANLLRFSDKYDGKIDTEIQTIEKMQATSSNSSKFMIFAEFHKPELYKPFLIMLTFFAILQFSGIYVMFVFTAQFIHEAHVTVSDVIATDVAAAIRCIATVFAGFMSDKYGRKPTAIASSMGMFLSLIGLAACSAFDLYWTPTAMFFFFSFMGTLGILTLPFSMVGEMFPQKVRSMAVGLSLSFCFLLSFITIKTFSFVFEFLGAAYIFSLYAGVSFIGILFSIYILPETKGKSLQEIEDYFKK
jgi:MFS family permease